MERTVQYILAAGECCRTIVPILMLTICSLNASYGVGSFYQGNSTTDATPDVYWLNNFETLYSSFGMTHYDIT